MLCNNVELVLNIMACYSVFEECEILTTGAYVGKL